MALAAQPCARLFSPRLSPGESSPRFEKNLALYSKLTDSQLFALATKSPKTSFGKELTEDMLFAYAEVLWQRLQKNTQTSAPNWWARKSAHYLQLELLRSLRKKSFRPELLAQQLADLWYASRQRGLNPSLAWWRDFPTQAELRERNFAILVWTKSVAQLLQDFGFSEQQISWYRKIWHPLVRLLLSYSINSVTLPELGILADAYSHRHFDRDHFFQQKELLELSLQEIRSRYLQTIPSLAEKSELFLSRFTKLLHRSALASVILMALSAAPYELAYQDRATLERELLHLHIQLLKEDFGVEEESLWLTRVERLSKLTLVYEIRSLKQELKNSSP